jgi:menaquinone-dependent protoporphyrinogen oxidase
VRVLVTAAGRHGSTAQIAARIGGVLRTKLSGDAIVDVLSADDVDEVAAYDAVVVGSAVYMGGWMPAARHLAERIAALPSRPVWLFSSGPIGDPPKPDEDPAEIGGIVTATRAREHRLFSGRLDRHRLGFGEKAVVMALRVPDGDFRDWDMIDHWGTQIAAELSPSPASSSAP